MSAYPYRGTKGTCMKTEGDYKAVVGVANVKECDEIRKLLDSNPVTVAVNAQDWQSYRSGVFDGCKSIVVNHDILMTGATLTYWRLKNSWGKTWGEYGYIRLKLGNTCGVCDNPAFGFV